MRGWIKFIANCNFFVDASFKYVVAIKYLNVMSACDRTNVYEEAKIENSIEDAERMAHGEETPQENVSPQEPDAVSEEKLREDINLINPDENTLDRG